MLNRGAPIPARSLVSRHPRRSSIRARLSWKLSAHRAAPAQARRGQPVGAFPAAGPFPAACALRTFSAPENMAAAGFAAPRAIQLRVFTERLLRGGVRELLRPRLSGSTPGSERDFSLSHSRVRAGSECWGSLPLVELVMAEACFEKRAETGWAPNRGWWALPEVPAASGGGFSLNTRSLSLPRPPGHGHCRALVEGAASGRRPETAPAPATPRLQARGRHETPAQRQPGAHPHPVGGR